MSAFDKLLDELSALGCESWRDLTPQNRKRLVRLYMQHTHEWAEAIYGRAESEVLDAYETYDDADLGLSLRLVLNEYVRPHVDKELRYKALCRREAEEMRGYAEQSR